METKETGQQDMARKNENIYRGAILALILGIAVLSFFLITSRRTLQDVRQEREITAELNLGLQMELDSVLFEYNQARQEYDMTIVEKDSIIQASAKEIQQLIARQADYNRIRRQLNALREVTQTYVHEIDSLHTVARELRAENVQIKENLRQVQQRTTELVQDKQLLEGKVEKAAVLRAYQMQADAIRLRTRDREEETDRARRAEQLRLCFTLAENPIAPPGIYNLYMRIAGPDESILRLSDDDIYSFVFQQDTLQYSVKGTIDYRNREISACLYWERTGEFEPGVYSISLFTDDARLGETSVTLR